MYLKCINVYILKIGFDFTGVALTQILNCMKH